jgi:inosose dehydratase
MSVSESRRRFLFHLGTLDAASAIPVRRFANVLEPPLYPPLEPVTFEKPSTPALSEMRFGYAAITWGGEDTQAIKDIREVGFHGIQLRANSRLLAVEIHCGSYWLKSKVVVALPFFGTQRHHPP